MNRIRLLPEQVANQIAAGEVIERAASVVKELVENSLDAQAGSIRVHIQGGGRSLIRVSDDGMGMSRDDALLSLERHATSKIQRAEDLAAISTMGFRGEALPSIASISRFTLTTREAGEASPEGTRIVINGGKMAEVKAAGTATGTTIEVRQIFFNLPARRKFLRSEETESAHIQHYLMLAALAYPTVAFDFEKDGRMLWQLPGLKTGPSIEERLSALRERLRALHGGEQKLLPLHFSAPLPQGPPEFEDEGTAPGSLTLWGFIGAPGVSRSTRQDQNIFVNKRPVESRGLNFALMEGYHNSLMKGRFPVCCLFLEIDPAAVDINIHPAKREVKFHREADVRRLVARAVQERLKEFHSASTDYQEPHRALPNLQPGAAVRLEKPLPNFPASLLPPDTSNLPETRQPALPMGFQPTPSTETTGNDITTAETNAGLTPEIPRANLAASPTGPAGFSMPVPLLRVPLRLVGVVGRLYVVLESDRGLVLLDQHAAHERILFEQMLQRLEQNAQAASQKLLLPETIELSTRDSQFLRDQLGILSRLGVGLSEFGERTFLLDALPPFVKAPDARQFVLGLVDELKAAGQGINPLRLGEHTVAKTVCRHAVKANDPLTGRELENLVADLRRCEMPYTCPHGRPTLIEMNFRELEKKFGRTQ